MKLEAETELRSKNTPVITDYRHRCRERKQNENLHDFNFKTRLIQVFKLKIEVFSHDETMSFL